MQLNKIKRQRRDAYRLLMNVGFILALSITGFGVETLSAWTPTSSEPPQNNADIPINEGGEAQVKEASLGIEALLVNGQSFLAGLLNLNNHTITNVSHPNASSSAANRAYSEDVLQKGGNGVLYLPGGGGPTFPAECPAGWVEITPEHFSVHTYIGTYWEGNSAVYYYALRTCVAPVGKSCRTMELRSVDAPAQCPAGWEEADYKFEAVASYKGQGGAYNNVRTCYQCN